MTEAERNRAEIERMNRDAQAHNEALIEANQWKEEIRENMKRQTQAILQRNIDVIDDWTHGGNSTLEDFPLEDYLQGKVRQEHSQEDPQSEIDAIRQDKRHPYNNLKASREEHQEAVDYVNSLIARTRKRG